MEKIASETQLIEAIRLLEIKQKEEGFLLKEQFKITYESLKPVNLIKNTVKDLITTPDLKANLLSSVLSIATGYASKKMLIGETTSPIKRLLGSVFQMGVTSMVSPKAEAIVSGIANVIKHIALRKNKNTIK